MRCQVVVTDSHIENGVRGDCERCMVANAIRPLLRPNATLEVYVDGVDFRNREGDWEFRAFPARVQSKIERWDETGKARRFAFVLDIPDQFLKPTITQGN